MKNKNNNLIVTIVIVVLVGALAFYGGMQYEKSKSSTSAMGAAGGQFAGGQGGFGRGAGGAGGAAGSRRAGGNATMGQIVSINGDTMTVKLQDGSSKIVDLSDKTTFTKSSTATKADFKAGDTVTAFGTTNSDGSVTAMMVSSGMGMRGMMRGGGGAAPSGQPAQ